MWQPRLEIRLRFQQRAFADVFEFPAVAGNIVSRSKSTGLWPSLSSFGRAISDVFKLVLLNKPDIHGIALGELFKALCLDCPFAGAPGSAAGERKPAANERADFLLKDQKDELAVAKHARYRAGLAQLCDPVGDHTLIFRKGKADDRTRRCTRFE